MQNHLEIYLDVEKQFATINGWSGIVRLGNKLIGYPPGADTQKTFRQDVPRYICDAWENEKVQEKFHIYPEVNNNAYYGDMYVSFYNHHPTQKLAKQYLIVVEAIEKMDEEYSLV